ncbi:MAG: Transketolase, partial [Thermotogales bacterium 46_20]
VGVEGYAFSGSNEDLYELAGLSTRAIVERVRRILA